LDKVAKKIDKIMAELNRRLPKFQKYVTVECKNDADTKSTFDQIKEKV